MLPRFKKLNADPALALKVTMKKVEQKLFKFAEDGNFSLNVSGCTATIALIAGNKLYIANVGDSKAFICSGESAQQLSIDHTCAIKGELDRIIAHGGHVKFNPTTKIYRTFIKD